MDENENAPRTCYLCGSSEVHPLAGFNVCDNHDSR